MQEETPEIALGGRTRRRRSTSRAEGVGDAVTVTPRGAVAFAVGGGAPLFLAFSGGGYDVVVREEVGLVLWWGMSLAFAFGWLPSARLARGARIPIAGLAALAALSLLALAWTDSYERTAGEVTRIVGLLGVLVLVLSVVNRDTWRQAAAGLAAAALAVAAASAVARVFPAALGGAENLSADGRLIYPLEYWNAVGAWSSMAIALGLAWSVAAESKVVRAAALGLLPLAGLALHLSYSRAAVVGALVAVGGVILLSRDRWTPAIHALAAAAGTGLAIVVVRTQPEIVNGVGGSGGLLVAAALGLAAWLCARVALATRRGPRRELRAGLSPAVVVTGALVLTVLATAVLGPRAVTSTKQDVIADSYPTQGSDPASRLVSTDDPRLGIWDEALQAFAENPLEGIGPGTFQFRWVAEHPEPVLRDAHSLYIETAAELGLPGLLALCAALGGLIIVAVRSTRGLRGPGSSALAAGLITATIVYCLQAGVDWLWEIPALGAMAVTAGGIAIASAAEPRRRRKRKIGADRVAMSVVAGLLGAMMIPGIASTEFIRSSATLTERGVTAEALSYADSAVAAAPWSASAHAQRAIAERFLGDLGEAREDAERAIDLEPDNWQHHYLLARVEFEAGDDAAALESLKDSARLQAVDPDTITNLDALRDAP